MLKSTMCIALMALAACAQTEAPRGEQTPDQMRERIVRLEQRLRELESRTGGEARPQRERASDARGEARPQQEERRPQQDEPREPKRQRPDANSDRPKQRGEARPQRPESGAREQRACPHCGKPLDGKRGDRQEPNGGAPDPRAPRGNDTPRPDAPFRRGR